MGALLSNKMFNTFWYCFHSFRSREVWKHDQSKLAYGVRDANDNVSPTAPWQVYYKEAVGAFVVFDVTRLATFEAVQTWKKDLDNKVLLPNGKSIPAVLLANKVRHHGVVFGGGACLLNILNPQSDLKGEVFLGIINQLDEYCKEKGFEGWFETSAKENTGIEEASRFLVSKVSVLSGRRER